MGLVAFEIGVGRVGGGSEVLVDGLARALVAEVIGVIVIVMSSSVVEALTSVSSPSTVTE